MFFAAPAELRSWLERHRARETELWVGFHKKASEKPSITWAEAVDQALCFGWIDGVRKSLGETSYMIRFTPRKRSSNWSAVNVRRAKELIELGLMRPAGLKAFEARTDDRSATYSYEQRHAAKLTAGQERRFHADRRPWAFFRSQPPSYRTAASAKRRGRSGSTG